VAQSNANVIPLQLQEPGSHFPWEPEQVQLSSVGLPLHV
jgi:hypothetical protein